MLSHSEKFNPGRKQSTDETAELQWAEDAINGLFGLIVFYVGVILRAVGWCIWAVFYIACCTLAELFRR
jgi:hypothetical protein